MSMLKLWCALYRSIGSIMADQVEVNVDASTSSSVSHNSNFSFDADVSGTSSLDTCFRVSRLFLTTIMGLSSSIMV